MHKMFKQGILIRNRKGTYIIDDFEDNYVAIRDIVYKGGIMCYGKRRIIGVKDLDNYVIV